MRSLLALLLATASVAIALPSAKPAQAGERWPAIPEEVGVGMVGSVGSPPWRCAERPVYNFYHDALYDQPPAVYRGFAYRPFYRYTAYRVVPRTYVCSGW